MKYKTITEGKTRKLSRTIQKPGSYLSSVQTSLKKLMGKKFLNAKTKSIPGIDPKANYLADLYYAEDNPTIEFTTRPEGAMRNYFIPHGDVYVGSWKVKGSDLSLLGTIIPADALIHPKLSANKISINMDKLGFQRILESSES